MKKLFSLILVLGLLFGGVASAKTHHSFLVCENKWEIEINLKEKKIHINGFLFKIDSIDDLYIKASKETYKQIITINRYTGDLTNTFDGSGSTKIKCKFLERKI